MRPGRKKRGKQTERRGPERENGAGEKENGNFKRIKGTLRENCPHAGNHGAAQAKRRLARLLPCRRGGTFAGTGAPGVRNCLPGLSKSVEKP